MLTAWKCVVQRVVNVAAVYSVVRTHYSIAGWLATVTWRIAMTFEITNLPIFCKVPYLRATHCCLLVNQAAQVAITIDTK
jgi:hypothetical protein